MLISVVCDIYSLIGIYKKNRRYMLHNILLNEIIYRYTCANIDELLSDSLLIDTHKRSLYRQMTFQDDIDPT